MYLLGAPLENSFFDLIINVVIEKNIFPTKLYLNLTAGILWTRDGEKFIMRPKFQKQSALKLVGRIIPQSGTSTFFIL